MRLPLEMRIKVHGKPIKDYLRQEAYKDQIPLLRNGLAAAAKSGGYTLKDAEEVFSTKFSQEMCGPDATQVASTRHK
jgi:hypothetical protein